MNGLPLLIALTRSAPRHSGRASSACARRQKHALRLVATFSLPFAVDIICLAWLSLSRWVA